MANVSELVLRGESSVQYITKSTLSLIGVIVGLDDEPLMATVGQPLDVVAAFTVAYDANPSRQLRWAGKIELTNNSDLEAENIIIEASLQAERDEGWRTIECLVFSGCCSELSARSTNVIPFSYDFSVNNLNCIRGFRVIFQVAESVESRRKNHHCKEGEKCEQCDSCPKPECEPSVPPRLCIQLPFDTTCRTVEDGYQFCSLLPSLELTTGTFQVTKQVTYTAAGLYTGDISGELILANGEFLRTNIPFVVSVS